MLMTVVTVMMVMMMMMMMMLINELAAGQTEIHRRITTLRHEIFHVKHVLHLHSLKQMEVRRQELYRVTARQCYLHALDE